MAGVCCGRCREQGHALAQHEVLAHLVNCKGRRMRLRQRHLRPLVRCRTPRHTCRARLAAPALAPAHTAGRLCARLRPVVHCGRLQVGLAVRPHGSQAAADVAVHLHAQRVKQRRPCAWTSHRLWQLCQACLAQAQTSSQHPWPAKEGRHRRNALTHAVVGEEGVPPCEQGAHDDPSAPHINGGGLVRHSHQHLGWAKGGCACSCCCLRHATRGRRARRLHIQALKLRLHGLLHASLAGETPIPRRIDAGWCWGRGLAQGSGRGGAWARAVHKALRGRAAFVGCGAELVRPGARGQICPRHARAASCVSGAGGARLRQPEINEHAVQWVPVVPSMVQEIVGLHVTVNDAGGVALGQGCQ